VNRFLDALQFLTRVPVPAPLRRLAASVDRQPQRQNAAPSMQDVAAAQAWFVAIGLLIGLALLGADRVFSRALPPASVAVLDVVVLVLITGALHLDGLADAADGLFGAHDRERRLTIMRDTHAGTYAIVAIVAVLAMKWAGIVGLPNGVRFEALILAPCLARFGMLAAVAAFPYARADGTGAGFHERASPIPLIAGAATALVAAVMLLGAEGTYLVALAAACALALGAVSTRIVGGLTGDVYGATVEIAEAALLLFIAAMAHRGWAHAWLLG
jgi:adenosylcobinamide-GDP ribazoletransferase